MENKQMPIGNLSLFYKEVCQYISLYHEQLNTYIVSATDDYWNTPKDSDYWYAKGSIAGYSIAKHLIINHTAHKIDKNQLYNELRISHLDACALYNSTLPLKGKDNDNALWYNEGMKISLEKCIEEFLSSI